MSTPRAPAPSQPGDDGDRSPDAVTVRRVEFPTLSDTARETPPHDPDVLANVEVSVAAVLGAAKLTVRDILSMSPGTIVHLDSLAGQSVEIRVNNVPIAGGEVIVVDDQYAVRLNNIRSSRRVSQDFVQQPDADGEVPDEPADA